MRLRQREAPLADQRVRDSLVGHQDDRSRRIDRRVLFEFIGGDEHLIGRCGDGSFRAETQERGRRRDVLTRGRVELGGGGRFSFRRTGKSLLPDRAGNVFHRGGQAQLVCPRLRASRNRERMRQLFEGWAYGGSHFTWPLARRHQSMSAYEPREWVLNLDGRVALHRRVPHLPYPAVRLGVQHDLGEPRLGRRGKEERGLKWTEGVLLAQGSDEYDWASDRGRGSRSPVHSRPASHSGTGRTSFLQGASRRGTAPA